MHTVKIHSHHHKLRAHLKWNHIHLLSHTHTQSRSSLANAPWAEVLMHSPCVSWCVFLSVLLLCLCGNRSSSSGGDTIKTYPYLHTQRCQQDQAKKSTQPHSGTWNAPVNRAIRAPAPGTLCTYCRQPLATWEFQRTYGSLSLGNSLWQNLNKLRAIPRKVINSLFSATHKDTHVYTRESHTNAD